jgi:integrase
MVDPFLRGLWVDQIGRRTIADMVASRKKAGATNATIKRDLTAVSRVLASCMAWDLAEMNAAKDYDRSMVKERRDPIVPPTDEAVEEMIARCQGNFARLVRFLAQTGMRQQEAVQLEWRQFNKATGAITLYKTKNGRPRTITLSPAAVGTISGTVRHLKSPFVFWQGDDGLPYANFSSRFALINSGQTTKADLAFRCHDLRHRFAIHELESGRDIYDLSKHLGHSSIKVTEMYLGYVPGRVGTKSGTEATVFSEPKREGVSKK